MLNPLDLDRLAYRIEGLERRSTHDWMPGDEMEFRRGLADPRVRDTRGRLPSAQFVREQAALGAESTFSQKQYLDAIQVCLRLESLISRNRPTSIKRQMYDMSRGRMPGFRR